MIIDGLIERATEALRPSWPKVEFVSLDELVGGASSLTYRAELTNGPAERVVLKAAPPGLEPVRNRDVFRQANLLDALASNEQVKVPTVFARSAGTSLDQPPLYVMSFDAGDSIEPLHYPASLNPGDVRSRGQQAARMLGALQRVDTGQFDERVGTPRYEVEKWARAFETVPDELREGWDAVRDSLLSRVPDSGPPVLLHGDWRLGNMLSVGGEVNSVIDWEIWSIGDGRMDLGWFLNMCDPHHPAALGGAEIGLPDIDELVSEYEQNLGTTVVDLGWFRALAIYKQASTTALIVKNAAKRGEKLEVVIERVSQRMPLSLLWTAEFLPRAGS